MKHRTLEYYPFIDGLRAIAVLGVLFFHYNFEYISGGYVGVDVFFVLSGFLITGLIDTGLRRNTFTLAHFYERRCRRILPAIFIVCTLSVIAALFLLMPHDFKSFAKSLKGTALFYSNMIFARTNGYFADPISTRVLLHTWSLAVEEQFYLFFPPLFYGIYKVAKGHRKTIAYTVGALFLASLLFNLVFITIDPDKAFYILPTRAWELLAGSLVFLALRHIPLSRPSAEVLSLVGAFCIALSFLIYDRNTLFPGWAAILPCAGTALLIWPNLQNTTITSKILSSRPLVLTGLISYGLYLYHWPILVFSRYYLDRELNTLEILAAMIATLALSVISYRFIETPIRSGTMFSTRKKVFQFSIAGIIIMVIFALAGAKTDGFPSRFSGAVLQYASGNKDTPDWERRMPALEDLNEETAIKIGAPFAPPTFLVWGDSHAEALAPAIEAQAKALGVTGLFIEYSGCLPLLGVSRLDHSPKNASCDLVGEHVLSLLEHYQIQSIILAGRWGDIFGWEKGSIEVGRPEPVISFTMPDGRQATHEHAFAPAFKKTINQLTQRGVHVWVVEQIPPQLIDVPSGLAKAVYLGRDLKTLERSYQDIEARRKSTNAVFLDFRNTQNVFFIDPARKFCPERERCIIAYNDRALYRDSNHLSIYGALWSQGIFDQFFQSLRTLAQK